MVARWRDGFDVVYAQRRSREGETLPKRIVSAAGYRVIRRIADVEIPPNTGDFRLMSRRVVRHVVGDERERTDSYAASSPSSGFPQTQVLYDRDPRAGGEGKYNRFFGSLVIGMNGIVGFSRYPLHLISVVGLVLSLFAGLFALAYAIFKFAGCSVPDRQPDDRDPRLVPRRDPAAQPRHHGRVRRPDLRGGEAPAAVHRRVHRRVRRRRRRCSPRTRSPRHAAGADVPLGPMRSSRAVSGRDSGSGRGTAEGPRSGGGRAVRLPPAAAARPTRRRSA